MTLTNGMSIRDMIDSGVYDVELDEPTPLEKKAELVDEVKLRFYEDLLFRDYHLETINLAWVLSEDVYGEDEALNPIFLHTVMKYVEILEEFIKVRVNEV